MPPPAGAGAVGGRGRRAASSPVVRRARCGRCPSSRTRCTSTSAGCCPTASGSTGSATAATSPTSGRTRTAPRRRRAGRPARPGVRLLPGLGQRLLPVVPAHGRRGPRPGAAPRRLRLRGRHPRRRRPARGPDAAGAARRAAHARRGGGCSTPWSSPTPTCGPHTRASRSWSPGTTTRCRTTTPTTSRSTRATSPRCAPPPTRRGTSTSRCGRPARPDGDGPRIYRRLAWGDLAQIDIVDGRQYRTIPACGWGEADACEAAYDPSATMLGDRQERWLFDGLGGRRAAVEHAGQQRDDGPARPRRRQGRPALARRLGRLPGRPQPADRGLAAGRGAQPGRAHRRLALDVRQRHPRATSTGRTRRWSAPSSSARRSRPTATTPVYGPYYGPMIKFNPHIKFFDGDRRGYVRCVIDTTG